jgi:hypothetical protein
LIRFLHQVDDGFLVSLWKKTYVWACVAFLRLFTSTPQKNQQIDLLHTTDKKNVIMLNLIHYMLKKEKDSRMNHLSSLNSIHIISKLVKWTRNLLIFFDVMIFNISKIALTRMPFGMEKTREKFEWNLKIEISEIWDSFSSSIKVM